MNVFIFVFVFKHFYFLLKLSCSSLLKIRLLRLKIYRFPRLENLFAGVRHRLAVAADQFAELSGLFFAGVAYFELPAFADAAGPRIITFIEFRGFWFEAFGHGVKSFLF